jgi:hypothetical protein
VDGGKTRMTNLLANRGVDGDDEEEEKKTPMAMASL